MRLWSPESWGLSETERKDNQGEFPIEEHPAEVRSVPEDDDVLSAVCRALARVHREPPQGRLRYRQDTREDLIKRCLPVLDGFNQIFRFGQQKEAERNETLQNWLKAMKTIHRHLLSVLEREGLTLIPTVGERLDLNRHEVVDVRETFDVSHDIIVEEVECGYEWNGRVLRDARVIVARRPS